MSYKHNNLMAMRHKFWNEDSSAQANVEKQFLQRFLIEQKVFENATLDDAKYFYFSLPSNIIVKSYGLGFINEAMISLMEQFINEHRTFLINRTEIQIKYRM
jgi:hypothetical protein